MGLKNYDAFLGFISESNGVETISTDGTHSMAPPIPPKKKYVIYSHYDFTQIIQEVYFSNKNNSVSRGFLSIIGDSYGKYITSTRYLSCGDKNDELEFIPTSKIKEDDYSNIFYDKKYVTRQSAKIGRVVRRLLEDNDIKFSDKELEEFVNEYKQFWDCYRGDVTIQVVEGRDIIKWYLSDNYSTKTTVRMSGTLGKSCMGGHSQQQYLKIYEENPEVCKMIIQKDAAGKLISRALFWKLDPKPGQEAKYYLDRIYYTFDHQVRIIKNWFLKNIDKSGKHYTVRDERDNRNLSVSVKKFKYQRYPYMDTFSWLDARNGKLFSSMPENVDYKKVPLIEIRDVNGRPNVWGPWVFSEFENRWILGIHSVWDEKKNSFVSTRKEKFISFFRDFSDSYWNKLK